MDPLLILLAGAVIAYLAWSWLARRGAGGSRRPAPRRRSDGDVLGLRTPREIVESRESLEAEDVVQMLAASNARRRRRGEPERTLEEVESIVASGVRDQRRRRDALAAERELDQLLDATNARRRARGLPERTREQVRVEFGE